MSRNHFGRSGDSGRYVDESACIGCTYCADIARGTFFMHEEAGRARVFDQGGDNPEVPPPLLRRCSEPGHRVVISPVGK